ncbi:type iv secretory 4 component [Leptolyngbya sp. Heron Island J]|uniref:hypothetical protein n=1 Tax=Leptolyngbya sp. Heron Island J TaxID=1385935 RepID=UPI0003B9951F|nr:hypothetical protein [Leptolyngbya sp. Heron Island J]ESA34133.1 type iv secretory 4 component [Leptolyngbya sp. Heron Island J]
MWRGVKNAHHIHLCHRYPKTGTSGFERLLPKLICVKDIEKTVSNNVDRANETFTHFMKASGLDTFCSHTSISLDQKDKQLLIFEIAPEKRSAVGALATAVLQIMIITCNLVKRQKTFLIVAIKLLLIR